MARGSGAGARPGAARARNIAASPTVGPPPPKRRPRRLLGPEEGAAVAAAYKAGATIGQLIPEFNAGRKPIRDAILAYGELREKGTQVRWPLPPDLVAELVHAYVDERLNSDTIGARHRIAPARVLRALVEAGVELRTYLLTAPAALDDRERAAIAAAYAAGATLEMLQQRHHCGWRRVRDAVLEHGHTIRPLAPFCGRSD